MLLGSPSGKALVPRARKMEWGEGSAFRCTDDMTLSPPGTGPLPCGTKICIDQGVLAKAEVR